MSGAGDNRGRCEACERARAMLDDWFDGLLDHESVGWLESHLADCSGCAASFEQHRAISASLTALGEAADRIAGMPRRGEAETGESSLAIAGGMKRLVRWRSWVAVAAVLLMFVGASLYVIAPRHPAKTTTTSPGRANPITVAENDDAFSVACPEGQMVMPIASSNPRIHIVWLYDQLSPVEASEEKQPSAQPADENRLQGDDR